MKSVPISPAVAKALKDAKLNADEVLRKALNIKPEGLITIEGITFPEGTVFMAWYKDRPYWAKVEGGAIEIMGERFTSVSGPASKITGRPTNGWDFWQCRFPGKSTFVKLSSLRRSAH